MLHVARNNRGMQEHFSQHATCMYLYGNHYAQGPAYTRRMNVIVGQALPSARAEHGGIKCI